VTELWARTRLLGWPMPAWDALPPPFLDLLESLDAGYLSARREREETETALTDLERSAAEQAARLSRGLA